jgi:hypothetical protein
MGPAVSLNMAIDTDPQQQEAASPPAFWSVIFYVRVRARTLAGTYKSGESSERSTPRSNSDFGVMGHTRPVLTAQLPESLLR